MARFRLQRRLSESQLCYNARMSESLPADVREFVKQAVATGEFSNEDEVVVAAVRTFRELTQRHEALRADIQLAIDEFDRGEGQPLDLADIKSEVARNYQARSDAS